MDKPQSIWTIWADQPGYPDKHVVRSFEIPMTSPTPMSEEVADSLDAARALLPLGLSKAIRNPSEDPALVEMWMIGPRDARH
jgi:hypothetical protein